jgi:hypothetical protein
LIGLRSELAYDITMFTSESKIALRPLLWVYTWYSHLADVTSWRTTISRVVVF